MAALGLGDLPTLLEGSEGWAGLRAAVTAGASGTIDGAWGSAAALAVAALAKAVPVVVVLPMVADLPGWTEDLASFTGARPAVFPAFETWPVSASRGRLAPEVAARLRVLQNLLSASPPRVVLAPMAALIQPVPPRAEFAAQGRKLTPGDALPPDGFAEWLVERGYKRVEAVEYPGEFARRGGIMDVYPPDHADPVRLEFFGDDLESLRNFSAATQRSLGKLESLVVLPMEQGSGVRSQESGKNFGFFAEYLPAGTVVVLVEPGDLKEQARHFFDRVNDHVGLFSAQGVFQQLLALPSITLTAMPKESTEATAHLRVESVERFSGKVARVVEELDAVAGQDRVLIACPTEAEAHRLKEVLKDCQSCERLSIVVGHIKSGFRLVGRAEALRSPTEDATPGTHVNSGPSGFAKPQPDLQDNIVALGSHQLFQREVSVAAKRGAASRRVESRAIDSFLDLNDGDYVVHVAHGIGRFRGMRMLDKGDKGTLLENVKAATEEHLILEFRDGVFLYVPASRIDLVQKYVGGSQSEPKLSKLGGLSWGKQKNKVAEAVHDMAAEMIEVQAMRAGLTGEAMPPDSDWQAEFEAAFPFEETPDQLAAIGEVKSDLQRPKPMDRLICGDVGYGKTEVAIRAAFKSVDNGKQVAILVPTTVLAEQHYRTFTARFAEYPFAVDVINRFRTAGQQKKTIKRILEGEVDVIVGTHRLLSGDVKFKDLGLVIIDEEQRFGVEHKEKLKKLRAMVHILTMTATPIPRTLHASLVGIREISNLETPPADRQAVETRIIRWDDQLIRHAIGREMNRGGQVYFVHNRVHDIHDVAAKLSHLVPDAKIAIGHGQMDGHELEAAMVKFVRKEADILVATTIIESGVDIPNANTIFIDDADMYGLADLHQLRGRVGRSSVRAYGYMIVDPLKAITPQAQKRLKAIEEFAELGAGFKIAMRDLEIRGAGNILGAEQSGHIAAIGYEMYCHLLEGAVRSLKQLPAKLSVEVNVDLPWPAYLPRDYVPGQKLRIEVYRRLARLRDMQRLQDFRAELIDRYGELPDPAVWLLRTTEVRLLCVKWQITSVSRDGKDLIFMYKNRRKAEEVSLRSKGRLKVVDEKNLYLRLKPEEDDSAAGMYEMLKGLLHAP